MNEREIAALEAFETATEPLSGRWFWGRRKGEARRLTDLESLDRFESLTGLSLPSLYREAALRWPGHRIHPRGVLERCALDELLVVPCGVVDVMELLDQEGILSYPVELDRVDKPVWSDLIPIMYGDPQTALCLDFRFDPVDPPVVELCIDAYEFNRALEYVADSFLSFLEMLGGIETSPADGPRKEAWQAHVESWVPEPLKIDVMAIYETLNSDFQPD